MLIYFKEHFEKNVSQMIGRPAQMELRLVVDASTVISELIPFAKNGSSLLFKLSLEPFIKLYAPHKIIEEVEKELPRIADEQNLDLNLLTDSWRKLLSRIKIMTPADMGAWLEGYRLVGARDIEDVPYLALTFSFETHGIITRDKDIIEQPEIRTWKIGRVKSVVTIFKKGSFSFFVTSHLLLPMFQLVFKISVSILRVFLEVANAVIQFFSDLIAGVIKAVSRLPDWLKLLMGLATLAMILYDRTREAMIDFIRKIGKAIGDFMFQLYESIKGFIATIAPLIQITVTILHVLYSHIDQAILQLQSL
jgi:predicted nucleic acid-binding protein